MAESISDRPSYKTLERAKQFIRAQSRVAAIFLQLIPEMISSICEFLDVKGLKSLTYLLGNWRSKAQRRLLHSIDYRSHCISYAHGLRVLPLNPNTFEWGFSTSHYGIPQQCCTPEFRRRIYGESKPTRIRNVKSLTVFLTENKDLLRLVRNAHLRREPSTICHVDQLARKLKDTGSLKRLHVTGMVQDARIFLEQSSTLTTTMTSLHVDLKNPLVYHTVTLAGLHALLHIPSLNSICISRFGFGQKEADRLNSLREPSIYGLSSVESLTLADQVPQGRALSSMLKWIRSLESLHVQFDMRHDLRGNVKCLKEFLRVLSDHQKHTLVELHFSTRDCCYEPVFNVPVWYESMSSLSRRLVGGIKLAGFPVLKHVAVSLHALVAHVPDRSQIMLGRRNDFTQMDVREIFPATLETVVLRLGTFWRWERLAGARPAYLTETTCSCEFFKWLEQLHSKEHFPNMRLINTVRISSCQYLPHPTQSTMSRDRHQQLQANWNERGIELRVELRDRWEQTSITDSAEIWRDHRR